MPNPCNKQSFVHLHVHSEFSFLDGASHVEALVHCAAENGQKALALTDHDNLCGAPSFAQTCKAAGIKPILGVEFTLNTGRVVVLAKNRNGYSALCRLLTEAHLNNERSHPSLHESDLLENGNDLILLSGYSQSPLLSFLRAKHFEDARQWAIRFRERFGKDFFIEVQRTFEPQQKRLNHYLLRLAKELDILPVATNSVHYEQRKQAAAQDLLCCVKHLITVDEPNEERKINGELFLKSTEEMHELFSDAPDALYNTVAITERCEEYEISEPRFMPRFIMRTDCSPSQTLRDFTHVGAMRRYGTVSTELKTRLDYELTVISQLGFADYFLVVHDLVQFARQHRIRHAGRGSAADSAVAYCLDITKVDAFNRNLRFERFINPERAGNLPDIDIDFDSRYRDDVTQYVTQTYGKDHVATVCTFSRFRARSAIRDVAKALGFAIEDIDRMAKSTHWATRAGGIRRAIEKRPEMKALNIPQRRFELLFDLCEALDDLPRHISTHLGGVVITGDPIWEISPLQMAAKGVQVIQYDKEGVEDLHLLKLDLLCLRMLGAVEDSVTMLTDADSSFDLNTIRTDDPATFEMIRTGETAGAFQIESPAQMSLHPRLKTDTYEDIVASVALIRPGPVKGEMVEPFIRRRQGQEQIARIHPAIDRILEHTYGVVLYQEQVISIAVELAGFTPGQADTLRRMISHRRAEEKMKELGAVFVSQAVARGIELNIAETVFTWLQGYAGYGFCEAHAAAFGDTSYRTAFLLKHHPAEFFAAILNNQPMGFYSAATIVNEARRCKVPVLGPDVHRSQTEFTVQNNSIRVGLKQVRDISDADLSRITSRRPFISWGDFLSRCDLPRDVLENFVLCGACECFHANRRALLFSLGSACLHNEGELDLSASHSTLQEDISDFTLYEKVCHEWDILGFSPRYHPLQFRRESLSGEGVSTNETIKNVKDSGRKWLAAGWVIRPHTPPTKSGKTVVFFSLEDETGLLNVTVFPAIYEKYGHLIFGHPLLMVEGRKDRRGANSLVAERILDLSGNSIAPAAVVNPPHATVQHPTTNSF